MDISEIEDLKKEILSLIEDQDLLYISTESIFYDIKEKFKNLNNIFTDLYLKTHTNFQDQLKKNKVELESNSSWKFITKLSSVNTQLNKDFDLKYSIKNITNQLKCICNQTEIDVIKEDVNRNGLCSKCNNNINDMEVISTPKEEVENFLKNEILEKMKNETKLSLLEEPILSKIKADLDLNTIKIDELLQFYNSLDATSQKKLVNFIIKLIDAKDIKLIKVSEIINSLKETKDKFYDENDFLNSLKIKISKIKKEIYKGNKNNMEWIFQ